MRKLIALLAFMPLLAQAALVHETSPSPVEGTGDFSSVNITATTASFTPPNNSILVAKIQATEAFVNSALSSSCSGGSLTWVDVEQWGSNTNGTASDAGNGYAAIKYALVTSGASMTVACTVTYESEPGYTVRLDVEIWTGHDTGDPIGATNHGGPTADDGTGISPTLISTTETIGRVTYSATDQQGTSGCVAAPSSTDTYNSAFFADTIGCGLSAYKASDHSASASVTGNMNANGVGSDTDGSWNWVAMEIRQGGPAATREQEGFRWGVDDGNEAAHGWEAAQDTNITIADNQSRLLRVLVDSTNDVASAAYTLRYQKNGSGGYVAVPVGSTSEPTPVIEVGDVTESGNNTATTSWAITHPAASTGDLLIWNVAWDDSTDTTALTAPSGPNGETLTTIEGPVASAGTAVRGKIFYTVATGSWSSGTLTFTPSASEQWTAAVVKVPAGEFDSSTPIGADNSLASSTTSNPSTPTLSAGASDGNGKLVVFIASDTDDADGTMTGWTGLVSTDRGAVAGDVLVRDTAVSDSESISSSTGLTYPAGRDWVSFVYVVRAPSVPNEVYIATSGNIASGGEATTARLTAPGAKSTSDFDTGRRWDDENGSDSTDITTDNYSEFEWLVALSSAPASSDFFDFRVYAGAGTIDTYTVTPRWTIPGSGASNAPRAAHYRKLSY